MDAKTKKLEMVVYFNFRSPYCYLASNNLFALLDKVSVNMIWRPLGSWSGRSDLKRAETKRRAVRQDIVRWASRLGLPLKPPPLTTDPTMAAMGSFQAERQGLLKEYIKTVMHKEWGEGQDIGQQEVLLSIAEDVGLDRNKFIETIKSKNILNRLDKNWQEAQSKGVFGVPSFVIGEEIFWGNDRLDFLQEYIETHNEIKRDAVLN